MKITFPLRGLLGVIGLAAGLYSSVPANAAITCSVSVTPISTVYDPTVATENISTGSVTVSCTRLATDPTTFAYSVAANNGLNSGGGGVNRAKLGANTYNYELYRTSPYVNGNRWQAGAASRISGTVSFGGSLSASDPKPFDLRVPGSQAVVPAGTYTDLVTVTLRDSGGTIIGTNGFGVSIITTNSCQLATPPGNINFTYTSFQGTPVTALTTFSTRCTSGLPYTLALDVTSGNLLGLNYTLSLSPTNATGTGITQSITINGGIAAGQAGTCPTAICSGSQARTVTITY